MRQAAVVAGASASDAAELTDGDICVLRQCPAACAQSNSNRAATTNRKVRAADAFLRHFIRGVDKDILTRQVKVIP